MIKYIGKCLFIEENNEKILVIGDIHLGIGKEIDRGGISVSEKMFDEMIDELKNIFERTEEIDKVVLLGDIKHDFSRLESQVGEQIGALFEFLGDNCKEVILVKGNHDSYLRIVAGKKMIEVKNYFIWKDYCFLHGDKDFKELYEKNVKKWIMAHVHPAVSLRDGVKEEKYKCFLVGKYKGREVIIVPSFLDSNSGIDVRYLDKEMSWKFELGNFDVKIVGENFDVLDFGPLKKIKNY